MSLFLRFACVKCPIRKTSYVKRFYWANNGFAVSEELRIRYFIPRTSDSDVDVQVQKIKDQHRFPGEFKLIYSFMNEKFLQGVTYSSFSFLVMIIFILFNYKKVLKSKPEDEHSKIKEEELTETGSAFSELIKGNDIPDVKFVQAIYEGDPRAKLAVALAMIISFFYVRSRIVLSIYRNNNDFITVFYKPLGFKKNSIQHKAQDCCYHPNKKYFNYNLLGRKVIIFPEFFVSTEEQELYVGGNKLMK